VQECPDGSRCAIDVVRTSSGGIRTEPVCRREPAHIIPGPNVTEGHIGEPAELPCIAMGWPRPTVTWWRDITMLPLSSRRYEQLSSYALIIRSVVYEDAGEYSCHAHNGIGSGAIFKVSLIIDLQPQPLPPAGGEEPDFNSRDSQPVILKPIEFGAPLQIDYSVNGPSEGVEVTWRHQNQIIEESDRRRLLSNHTLFITKAEVADSGEYRCIAEYKNSFSTSSIQIVVKGESF
ncbi:unnamed protein product, partial [Larinioides sclopetarius]